MRSTTRERHPMIQLRGIAIICTPQRTGRIAPTVSACPTIAFEYNDRIYRHIRAIEALPSPAHCLVFGLGHASVSRLTDIPATVRAVLHSPEPKQSTEPIATFLAMLRCTR